MVTMIFGDDGSNGWRLHCAISKQDDKEKLQRIQEEEKPALLTGSPPSEELLPLLGSSLRKTGQTYRKQLSVQPGTCKSRENSIGKN